MGDAWTDEAAGAESEWRQSVTQKPRRFRRRRSGSETGSERRNTNQTGEDLNLDRFVWREGDLEVVYDPYAEKRRKRKQQP
jgi:hypothetical protein